MTSVGWFNVTPPLPTNLTQRDDVRPSHVHCLSSRGRAGARSSRRELDISFSSRPPWTMRTGNEMQTALYGGALA